MKFVLRLIFSALAVFIAAYLTPGVEVESFLVALIVAVVLGILNAILKPILVILTLPITIITLGLFALVINIALIFLTANLVPGFEIIGILPALIFGFVLSVVSWFLAKFID